jgi:N-acylneuraminate-9-phosphatase
MLDVVLFDLDNTLIDTQRADDVAYTSIFRLLEGRVEGPNEVISLFRKLLSEKPVDPKHVVPVDDWRTRLWAQSLEETNNDAALCKEVYLQWKRSRLTDMSVSVETVDMLRRLRTQYKIVLLTNGDSQVQWEKIRKCDIEELFDAVVVSGDTQWEKPDKRIFAYACQLIGRQCENAVMVGDNLNTDIQGAINAKLLASVWFHPLGQVEPPTNGPCAQYTIQTISQLPDILAQLDQQRK